MVKGSEAEEGIPFSEVAKAVHVILNVSEERLPISFKQGFIKNNTLGQQNPRFLIVVQPLERKWSQIQC